MTHRVGLMFFPGEVHAWVLDLPGCIAGAPTVAALEAALRLAIAEYKGWLRSHGMGPDDDSTWEFVDSLDGPSLGSEFCFEEDALPLTRDELQVHLRTVQWARADLAAATRHLAPEVLDWAPPSDAFDRFDAWAPEVRTVRDVVRHVLELEVYYRAGLRDGPVVGIFERVGTPHDERRKTVELLSGMSNDELSRCYWPVRPGRTTPEEWTVRKTLRRLISHERTHTAEIWQRRSWAILGIPRGAQTDGFGDEA